MAAGKNQNAVYFYEQCGFVQTKRDLLSDIGRKEECKMEHMDYQIREIRQWEYAILDEFCI